MMLKSLRRTYGLKAFNVPRRCKGNRVDPEVIQQLNEGFERLQKSDTKSLLKKHLSPQLFEKLKAKQTKTSTLLDCIQSGLEHFDSPCGIYAACPRCYKVFAELFDPIIADIHCGFQRTDKQPSVDFGDPTLFEDLDPRHNFIGVTRIGCARSLKGYPFNPSMTTDHYNEIEDKLHCISTGFQGEFKGSFHSLCCLDKPLRSRLEADQNLVKPDDRFLAAAKAFQYWPTGRGIFSNFDRTFLVWCNAEDHLSVISTQRGGNFAEVYARLTEGLCAIEKYLPFARDDRLGFLTFSPTNLGTALHASVRIRIPKMATNTTALEEVAQRYKLLIRSHDHDGLYEISNGRRLGLTEFSAVSDLYCGIREIIQLEKGLPVTKKKPQPPPPHIDPQKAIRSGLIDERRKKRSPESEKSTGKTPTTGTKHSQKPVVKMDKYVGANAEKKNVQVVERKPDLKKTVAEKPSTLRKEIVKPTTKKTEPAAAVKSTKQIIKNSKVSKGCSKISTQSTDPCIRAGIEMPKIKKDNLDPWRCILQRKKRVPQICKTLKNNSEKSSEKKEKSDHKSSASKSERTTPKK